MRDILLLPYRILLVIIALPFLVLLGLLTWLFPKGMAEAARKQQLKEGIEPRWKDREEISQ